MMIAKSDICTVTVS